MELMKILKESEKYFNSEKTKKDLTELKNEIMKYDVHDVIATF